MAVSVPEQARCLGCGYRLRDLPDAVCPECGRAFDPLDHSTFDANPPVRRRRRRIIAALIVLVVIGCGVGLFPRRLLKSTMSFTCPRCGESTTITRWEPAPPEWTKLRYPGLHWTSRVNATAANAECGAHSYDVKVKVEMRVGTCTGTASYTPPGRVIVNEQQATPETAPTILESMMSPSNMGISIGSYGPDEADE